MSSLTIDLEEVREHLNVHSESKEQRLQLLIDSSVRIAELYIGRNLTNVQFDSDPLVTRTFPVRRGRRTVRAGDVREISLLTVDGLTVSAADCTLWRHPNEDRDPVLELTLPRCGARSIMITGRFGFGEFPAELKLAVLDLAARRWRERDAAFGDIVRLTQDEGGIVQYVKQLPASTRMVFDYYRDAVRVG